MPAPTRTVHPHLLVLFAIALGIFGAVVLNRSLARDALTCEEGACTLERSVPIPFGSLQSFRRTVSARDITKLEAVGSDVKTGDTDYVITYRAGTDEETANLRLRLDTRGAYDARRYFQDPKGRLALEGPRRARDYPFAAFLFGLSALLVFLAWKQRSSEPAGV